MGGLFESKQKTTTTKQPFETEPWKPQQASIKRGFSQAGKALTDWKQDFAAMGDLTAAHTPGQSQDLRNISVGGRDFANGASQQALIAGTNAMGQMTPGVAAPNAQADAFAKNATGILNTAQNPQGVANATGILSDVEKMNPSARANNIYEQAGRNVGGEARGIFNDAKRGGPNTQASAVFGDVSGDKTGSVVGNAAQYAANPYLDGQINAAIGDVNRGFQIERGNINSQVSGNGNINSTRAGTMEAYAAKDAMDRAAMISSGMRGEAYGKGLDLASQAEAQRQTSSLNANAQLQADDVLRQKGMLDANSQHITAQGQAMDAKLSANAQVMTGQQNQIGNRLDANGQIINAQSGVVNNALAANSQVGQAADRTSGALSDSFANYNSALGIAQGGYDMKQTGLSDSLTAQTAVQAQQQQEIEGQLRKMGMPAEMIAKYMATIGGSFGQSGYQTNVSTTQSASPFQQIVGGAASVAGAIGGFS